MHKESSGLRVSQFFFSFFTAFSTVLLEKIISLHLLLETFFAWFEYFFVSQSVLNAFTSSFCLLNFTLFKNKSPQFFEI